MNEEALTILEYEGMKALFSPHLMSDLGGARLKSLAPVTDVAEIRSRIAAAKECVAILDRGEQLPLRGGHDLRLLLTHVHEQGRPLEPEELAEVGETLIMSRDLVVAVAALRRRTDDLEIPHVGAMVDAIPGFTVLTDRIREVIDERGRVRDTASPRLSGVRSQIRVTREKIERRIQGLLSRRDVRSSLQEPRARLRSGRLVLAVKHDRRGEVRGVLHDVSTSGQTCFIEPAEVVPDGNVLEDLLAQETREVTRILWETTVRVLDFEPDIREALEVIARLDVAQASARSVGDASFCVPDLVDTGIERYRKARHPILLALHGRAGVVPIDIRLSDDFDLLVITGPNTGGKTVTLKTMGILQLMAQSGLPVPAESAEFTPLREVFVDVGDEQSLEQNLSTFSSHVKRIARFLAEAGPDTLVLLDELGSGTDPIEGAALGSAVLEFLYERRVPTVVTTHLGSLKTYSFTHDRASNASVEFDVRTLSPTYRLLLGQPGASNALTIAERLGLPKEVIEGARKLVRPEDRATDEILSKAQEIRVQAEEHRRVAEDLKDRSVAIRDEAQAELDAASDRHQMAEREAEDELNCVLDRVRKVLMDFTRELANAPNPFGDRARKLSDRVAEEIRATPLGQRREEFARALKKGDDVFVPRLSERFTVRQVKKKDRTLSVTRGSITLTVSFDDVSWL